MSKKFDSELDALRRNLLTMGATAEKMVRDTTKMLVERDMAVFEPVRKAEDNMDLLQRQLDEDAVRLISVYTPVAADLRCLLMATRITAELERIADKTMDIGFYAKTLFKEPPLKPLIDIPRMAEIDAAMLKKVLDAYTEGSAEKAEDVIKMDDEVDEINDQLFRELMTYVQEDVKAVSRVLELVLIARSYERIGDHAVNIAEDVVYMVRGKDIRHLKGEV
ncbi:MAG: phosphate signaling complex protein PhoU [bacterium]